MRALNSKEAIADDQGRKRLFRVFDMFAAVGACFTVQEFRHGEPTGWRFAVRFDPETEFPPYYQPRQKIAERLATRDVVRDPDTGRLEVLNKLIRAQIEEADTPEERPNLLVDGDVVTWEELG